MEKFAKGLGIALGAVALVLLIGFITAYPAMLLWNWLMPMIFGLTTLTFWQTLGLIILTSLLLPKHSSTTSKSK